MIRIIFTFLLLIINVFLIKAQNDSLIDITDSNLIIVTGIGYNNVPALEFGFGSASNTTWQDSGHFNMRLQHYIGSEFWFNENQIIYVPKYSFYIALKDYLPIPFTSGFSILYSTDFSSNSLGFRLEYGIPVRAGRIFYSYNIPVYNRTFVKSNVHQITFSWAFRISRKQKYKTYYNKETDSYYELFE